MKYLTMFVLFAATLMLASCGEGETAICGDQREGITLPVLM